MKTHGIRRGLILVACVSAIAACGEQPVKEEPVVRPVKIRVIEGDGAARTRELPGTIRAAQHADMGFEVSGRITEFLVKEGQQVAKGDVLARLDARDYQANLDQVNASLRKAQSDLSRSERIYQEDPGAISTSKIDSDRKAVEVAQAQVAKEQKAVDDTELRAPFDGLVARRLVEDYENIQAKQAVLVLQDISSLEIEVGVPERDVARKSASRDSSELTRRVEPRVQISSVPGRSFPARVKEFATTADPTTRTFQVRLIFEPPENANILPGMTARVTYNVASDGAIRLPSHAAFSDPEGAPHVWLVDPATMKVKRQPIKLGGLVGGEVEIVQGLEAGNQVAISGVSQLREGMQVRRYQSRTDAGQG